MAGSSSSASQALMSPGLHRVNGGGSRTGPPSTKGPASPGGSDVASTASGPTSRLGTRAGRMGNLHGAGLSSLHLAVGEGNMSSSPTHSPMGFNAISTLLNDPKRPQRPIDPSSSRYPAISQSHTDLPKVKRADFEEYISSTQKEWERFQRNVQLGSRGKARLESSILESESRTSTSERPQSTDDVDGDHLAMIGKKKLSPLSTVPQVFFAEDFDLGNPYTFDLVTERYKAAGSTNGTRNGSAPPGFGYDVALNQMLQEKLSYYSDVVEQHLILEISARSTSFFAALGNLQDLESEASHCLQKVEALKAELEEKDEKIAKAGLRVIREQAARREIVERLEAVEILQSLCEKKDLCRLLVQNGEWNEALEVMEGLRNVINDTQKLQSSTGQDSAIPPHVDLDFGSIASIKGMLPQLEDMTNTISVQLESDILLVLSRDLEERIGGPKSSSSDVEVLKSAVEPIKVDANGTAAVQDQEVSDSLAIGSEVIARDAADDDLDRRIASHLQGLIRTHTVDRVMSAYREVALKVTRATLRKFLIESEQLQADEQREDLAALLDDDEAASGKSDIRLSSGGAEAAGRLRDMKHAQFIDLLRVVLAGLTKAVKAVDAQTRVVLQVLAIAGRSEAGDETVGMMMPLGVSPSLPTTFTALVSDVGSLTHALGSRLVSLRSSVHVALSLHDFLSIFHLCWSFILQTEGVCKRMLIGFRGVVLNQAKLWLSNFHRLRIERAARAVEEENWNQAEVSTAQQHRLTLIVESATSDPAELLVSSKNFLAGDTTDGKESKTSEEVTTAKTLEIEDRQFFVVGATLDVLELLVEYVRVAINLPLLTTETMGRIVEFAKQFNSRTCQVVLGAGAMRSAGLKNITAKHLALASQSLSIMITLIPYVRETIRRHLSPTQAVMLIEFDKLKRDFQEHQNEIHSKLVAIMNDRLTVHCRALSNMAWNDECGVAVGVQPVADLTKEVITLHRVLFKFWHTSSAENVIGQVLAATDKRIAAELQKVEVKEEFAIRRMNSAKDIFEEKFKPLKSVEWSCKEIEVVIEEQKSALEKSKAAAAAAAAAAAVTVEKKEPVPAYKPRMNIFQRRNTQQTAAAGTRASLDAVEAPKEAVSVPEAVAETDVPHSEAQEALPTATPSVPAKDEVPATPEKTVRSDSPAAPPAPSKVDSPAPQIAVIDPEGDVSMEAESAVPPSPALSLPDTPTIPSTPITPTENAAPSTPGRMTLQQRLAEAARRRAQGGANRGTTLRNTGSGTQTPADVDVVAAEAASKEKVDIGEAVVAPETPSKKSEEKTEPVDIVVAQVAPAAETEPAKVEAIVSSGADAVAGSDESARPTSQEALETNADGEESRNVTDKSSEVDKGKPEEKQAARLPAVEAAQAEDRNGSSKTVEEEGAAVLKAKEEATPLEEVNAPGAKAEEPAKDQPETQLPSNEASPQVKQAEDIATPIEAQSEGSNADEEEQTNTADAGANAAGADKKKKKKKQSRNRKRK